ncbi:flavin-containing monooxygenase [Nocardia terpenica]|uniref:FAD/NAD(P)-binding domain-containing protein n=1 Tax=Nocardia terpenica TaxID=455432 RepID=A0A164P0A2_9NOCA|nr:NAD(P)/FAD-dependent oxidoreductase [Nocardia terpenica]KZM74943.1 hypothetical protein AWN90_23305 [Nocardia terpenica]
MTAADTRRPSVLIVGAGFGGLAMAAELARHGMRNSYSFAPNTEWPRRFSLQPDIKRYIEQVIDSYELRPHLRFGTEVTSAAFDADTATWHIETSTGQSFDVDVIVPATGVLSQPALPSIPGRDSFEGKAFHSARWDHDYDLTGKRVAVIGTGATAIQFHTPDSAAGRATHRLPALRAVHHSQTRHHLRPPAPARLPCSYGITVPGFPDMFLVYGSNTSLGAGSIIYMLERQARYIRQLIEHLAAHRNCYLDIRREVEQRYDDEIQHRLQHTAWTGCASWYRNTNGRVTANWPGTVTEYHRRTRTADLSDFHLIRPPHASPTDSTKPDTGRIEPPQRCSPR